MSNMPDFILIDGCHDLGTDVIVMLGEDVLIIETMIEICLLKA